MILKCLKLFGINMKFRSCRRLLFFLVISANVTALFIYMFFWTEDQSIKRRPKIIDVKFSFKDRGHKTRFKTVYLATTLHNNSNWFEKEIGFTPTANCKFTDCYFSNLFGNLKTSNAVLFHGPSLDLRKIPKRHPPNQTWIFYSPDPPTSMLNKSNSNKPMNLKLFNGLFNWYASLKQDSDIVLSLGSYKKKPLIVKKVVVPPINYALGKSGFVAWIKESCLSTNHDYFVELLKKHIAVDIFGKCGNFNCSDVEKSNCDEIISKDYKFFLAFEQTNCHDHITKRFWWALNNSIIPITMGAKYEEYFKLAPPNSFIHTSQFESPKRLAHFLLKLAEDDLKYNTYFEWKKNFEVFIHSAENSIFCQVCAKLHTNYTRTQNLQDLSIWWNPEENCWI